LHQKVEGDKQRAVAEQKATREALGNKILAEALDKHEGLGRIIGDSAARREQMKLLAVAEVRSRGAKSLTKGPQLLIEALDALAKEWQPREAGSPEDDPGADPLQIGLGDVGPNVSSQVHQLPPSDGKPIDDLGAPDAGPRVFRRLKELEKQSGGGG
jgi:hypothetical protein